MNLLLSDIPKECEFIAKRYRGNVKLSLCEIVKRYTKVYEAVVKVE